MDTYQSSDETSRCLQHKSSPPHCEPPLTTIIRKLRVFGAFGHQIGHHIYRIMNLYISISVCCMYLYACTTWYAQCPGMLNYQFIYSNMESESVNLNTIRTDSEYNFVKLFNEALAENDDIGTINGSPFDHGDNECKYYSPENFAQNIHPTNNSLSLFCLNCRSISANWDCIHELICNLSSRGFLFDIIGLTEVFKIPDSMSFNITGYHCLQFQTRSDTDDGRGGVGLFINSNFTYVKRDDLSVFIPHVIESVFFEIQINERKTIIVGVVYRPNTQPRADIDIFMQKINEIQSKIKEENKVSYLMGDFNIDLLKVNIHAKTNEFVNDVISQGFLPKITRPTRITPHSATLIDHIYSNDNRPTSQNYTSGIIITDMADHFGTFHIVNKCKQPPVQKYSQIRQMKTDNVLRFNNILANADYQVLVCTSVRLSQLYGQPFSHLILIY